MKQLKILMAIMLVGAMLFSLASCGGSDDVAEEKEVFTTDEAVYEESLTPVANTSADVLNYFNTIVNGVKTQMPKMNYRYEKNVPNDSINITKTGAEDAEEADSSLDGLNKSAAGVKDMILKDIKKIEGEVAYGADNTEYLFAKGEPWASKLTVSDIDYAEIKEIGDNYYITIVFDDVDADADASSLAKAFDLRDKDEILASEEFAKTSTYLKFNDYKVAYSQCKITAVVNRFTDEVSNINYYKAANVTAFMTGVGTYEQYGDVSVMFTLEDKSNFDLVWESDLPISPLETTTEK